MLDVRKCKRKEETEQKYKKERCKEKKKRNLKI